MNLLKSILSKKSKSSLSYDEFWTWFQENEKRFYNVIKDRSRIAKDLFPKLASKLNEIRDGYLFLVGMTNDEKAEIIFTADGIIKNFVFIEELVDAAPAMRVWKFTALKPAMSSDGLLIEIGGYKFDDTKLFFCSNDQPGMPDEIDISIVHEDLDETNQRVIINGVYLYLDNFLGELQFATTIDKLDIIAKQEAKGQLVPIAKLKDYLIWRQKEFVEKYEGTRWNTDNDTHSIFEAVMQNGRPIVGLINSDLLNWDAKASHPWVCSCTIEYSNGRNGMPNEAADQLLAEIETSISDNLKDEDGYLYIGRETGDNKREIHIASKDFRKPSKLFHDIQQQFSNKGSVTFEIFKDKYWQSLSRFQKM